MIFDPIKAEAASPSPSNSFALRVLMYDSGAAVLTPSAKLARESLTVPKHLMPRFITDQIAMLKMLDIGGRIELVGKRYTDNLFYVYVDADVWENFIDVITKEK